MSSEFFSSCLQVHTAKSQGMLVDKCMGTRVQCLRNTCGPTLMSPAVAEGQRDQSVSVLLNDYCHLLRVMEVEKHWQIRHQTLLALW